MATENAKQYKRENETNIARMTGKIDKEDLKKYSQNNVPLLQEEQIMKYQGITIHKSPYANTWYTRFRKNGVQHFISGKTQKIVFDKLKKALKQTEQGQQIILLQNAKPTTPTLAEWYQKWLNLYKIGKVKEQTLRDYNTLLKNIPIEIQNKEIEKIQLAELIEIINACKAERQRQKLYDLLNMLYKKAIDNDIIEKNLMTRIDKPKHEKNHGQALTNEQQTVLINVCSEIKNADVMLIALYQGLRRGEVLGLTRDNIDFENNTLTINKAYNQHNQFDTTKNKQSMRTMPLFKESKAILLKYTNAKQRIFDLTTKQYEKVIDEIKEKAKIDNLKMKDMRSTFITRCKELNIPTHIIQSWVGHVLGSTVTNTVYTKHNTDADDKYINILNKSKLYSNYTHKKK